MLEVIGDISFAFDIIALALVVVALLDVKGQKKL